MKLGDFKLDRKDPSIQNYFTSFALDKRISKARMKEFLGKRYKD